MCAAFAQVRHARCPAGPKYFTDPERFQSLRKVSLQCAKSHHLIFQAWMLRAVQRNMRVDAVNTLAVQHQVTMLRKVNDAVQEQGKQALQLIQSAAPAPNGNVGSLLDIRA
jgi:hypothetical protein